MTPSPDQLPSQAEALSWLAGRLRWEQVLRDLHDRAEGIAPIAPPVLLPAHHTAGDDRAADDRAADDQASDDRAA